MDPLTHFFLPLTAAYVLVPQAFDRRRYLALGGLGLFADVDKFLGVPGLFHSILILGLVAAAFVLIDYVRGECPRYGLLAAGLLGSHLLLDTLDGGPVPLLAPFVESGIGFRYPAQITFSEGLLGVAISGPLITLATEVPRSGFNTYGFVNGFGVASVLLFAFIYGTLEVRRNSVTGLAQHTADSD